MTKNLINVYISSIHQNAGKTTISLGLFKLFQEHGLKTAFLKPVGQQTVSVGKAEVDKDSYLMGQVYRCRKFKDMSPVTIGRGYTEDYIFHPQQGRLRKQVENSYKRLTRGKDAILIEGTGHSGVGSVIDLSNSDAAALLGSKAIIISEGGIGRAIDEVMLNKGLFDLKGVEVIGVIINKVFPEKYERIKKALDQGLKNKGLKLLGVIPVDPLLTVPSIEQLMNDLKLKLLCGRSNISRRIRHTIVATMEPYNMVSFLKPGTLVLTSGDRVDNIMTAVSSHMVKSKRKNQISGIVLSGGFVPHENVVDLLKKSTIPVLMSDDDSLTIAGKIENLICKIQRTDKDKITEARHLVKQYVDVEAILGAFQGSGRE